MRIPELLSPAGSAAAMVAAVQCGADAVYLGAGDFNARRSADNFGGELDAAVGYCHARGARVYVTLNTMVRQDELARLENTIEEICRSGADGVIVQDFGVARAVHQMAPSLPLHASTQMAVHNPQGVEFLAKQGFTRVVTAREMSYEEIARCAGLGAELEVFIHGALCVSCSGQCLLSSMIGGRSGNRGLCAQPCRMKYRMDEHEGYLLSTRDLCGLDGLESLMQAGADSLKIEGRLKRPEYVALTTAVYREALDRTAKGEAFDASGMKRELAQMFNRGGFTKGYGFGVQDAELMFSERPNNAGVEIGICEKNGVITLSEDTDAADSLALRRPGSEDRPVHLSESAGTVRLPEAKKGDRLFRTVSQKQQNAARALFCGEHKKFPIDMQLTLKTGSAAWIGVSDGEHSVVHTGDTVQQAKNRPADPERIRSQMEKLGDTPFVIREYDAEIDGDAFLPVSALNALRRIAVEKLFEARFGKPHDCAPLEIPKIAKKPEEPELIVQSGSAEILNRALRTGADSVVFAPEDIRIDALNIALAELPERFGLALPPVMAENTLKLLNRLANENTARIMRTYISNIGQLNCAWPGEICGDMQLNIANSLSIRQLTDQGISRYTPSVELNRSQIEPLGGKRELIVYGRIPLMQLRHCPLRAANHLKGMHKSCRHCDDADKCEKIGAKALTDRMNAEFPLRRIASDEGCVIQLLNSAKLMLLKKIEQLPSCSGWRLLADAEDPVEDIVRLHRLASEGKNFRSDPAWQAVENMKTTTGHYFRGAE